MHGICYVKYIGGVFIADKLLRERLDPVRYQTPVVQRIEYLATNEKMVVQFHPGVPGITDT